MSDSYRKVALHLHALQSEDQEWVLNNLSVSHREPLQGFLKELSMLGIPKEMSLIEDVIENFSFNNNKNKSTSHLRDEIENLNNAIPLNIYSVLLNEPDIVIAQILTINNWKWTRSTLDLFHFPRRQNIERLVLNSKKLTNKAQASLLKQLLKLLDSSPKQIYAAPQLSTSVKKKVSFLKQCTQFLGIYRG